MLRLIIFVTWHIWRLNVVFPCYVDFVSLRICDPEILNRFILWTCSTVNLASILESLSFYPNHPLTLSFIKFNISNSLQSTFEYFLRSIRPSVWSVHNLRLLDLRLPGRNIFWSVVQIWPWSKKGPIIISGYRPNACMRWTVGAEILSVEACIDYRFWK